MVVLSSVAGVRVRRANYVYGASKAGLDAFAQGMAEALRGSGASLMIVRPGWVATRMTEGRDPAPFATTADAVAADVVAGMERSAAGGVVARRPLRLVFAVMRLVPRRAVASAPGLSRVAGRTAGARPTQSGPPGADVQPHVVDDRLGHGRGHPRAGTGPRRPGVIPATWVRRHTVSR